MKDFKITKSGDVIDKLFIYRDKYHERGKYLGFKNLHDHYSMMLGILMIYSCGVVIVLCSTQDILVYHIIR